MQTKLENPNKTKIIYYRSLKSYVIQTVRSLLAWTEHTCICLAYLKLAWQHTKIFLYENKYFYAYCSVISLKKTNDFCYCFDAKKPCLPVYNFICYTFILGIVEWCKGLQLKLKQRIKRNGLHMRLKRFLM